MMRPADTSPDAWKHHVAALRRMTGPERVAKAFEMGDAARALSEAGIRHRHPDWDDNRVNDALRELLLEPDLAEAVRRSRLVRA